MSKIKFSKNFSKLENFGMVFRKNFKSLAINLVASSLVRKGNLYFVSSLKSGIKKLNSRERGTFCKLKKGENMPLKEV